MKRMERAFNFNRRQRARDEKKGNENEKKKFSSTTS